MGNDLTQANGNNVPDVCRPETFRSQIDLAKYPQIFANKSIPRPREYEDEFFLKTPKVLEVDDDGQKRAIELPIGTRVEEKVQVGVHIKQDGTIRGLVAEHGDLIGMLEVLRENQKSKVITNSLSKFYDILHDGSLKAPRQHRRSSRYKESFSDHVEDLMFIVISTKRKYFLPNGATYTDQTTFKVLERNEIFKREDGSPYCDVSRLTMDESFIKATSGSRFKVKRLDQMVKLRKAGSKKLYNFLDWAMWDKTEKCFDVDELAKKLEIGRTKKNDRLKDIRVYCNDNEGLQFTHGMIEKVSVRKTEKGDWVVFVKKGPLPAIVEIETAPDKNVIANKSAGNDLLEKAKAEKEQEKKEEAELDAYHASLNELEKAKCETYLLEELAKIPELFRGNNLNRSAARYAAFRRHKEEAGAKLFFAAAKKRKPYSLASEPYNDDYFPDTEVIFRRLFPSRLRLEYKPENKGDIIKRQNSLDRLIS